MKTERFYNLLDQQLELILDEQGHQKDLFRHKDRQHNKGMAMLFWIAEFYGRKTQFQQYITEGKGDQSCDLIFPTHLEGEAPRYYIIQSKLYSKGNSKGQIPAADIKSALSDFDTLINGKRLKSTNERFDAMAAKLHAHLEDNGEARFLFIGASGDNPEAMQNVDDFNRRNAPQVKCEVFDINRLKKDYIEFSIKGINVPDRLDYWGKRILTKIEIPIIKTEGNPELIDNIIRVERPFRGIILLVRPKTVFELFGQYGFSLFFQNVRNPLPNSEYNQQIIRTLQKQPQNFWYFNNGVTAITGTLPNVGKQATKLTVKGLQIINGAQTFSSVYFAYLDASKSQREIMDQEARITLRIIASNDETINLEISKFTNSQNPIFDRDFHSNDDVQLRLQEESYRGDVWYEKRRGEFNATPLPKGISVVPNDRLALAYLVFEMECPTMAIKELDMGDHDRILFKSNSTTADGQLEAIFQRSGVTFERMYVSWLWFEHTKRLLIEQLPLKILGETVYDKLTILVMPIMKALIEQYLITGAQAKTSEQIRSVFERLMEFQKRNQEFLKKVLTEVLSSTYFALFKSEDELQKSLADANSIFYQESYLNALKEKVVGKRSRWASFPELRLPGLPKPTFPMSKTPKLKLITQNESSRQAVSESLEEID